MLYFLNLSDIGDTIMHSLRMLMGDILALLYDLIANLYVVFIYISKAEIIEESYIQDIYSRIGMILGIFMIFKLIFSLIQSLIEPEKLTDKKSGYGAILGRCVLSIVLLGITPSLFREAFKLQNLIVGSDNKNNVIYKLISRKNSSGDFYNLGKTLSSDVYFSFFTDSESPYLDRGIIDEIDEDALNGSYLERMMVDNYSNLTTRVGNDELTFYDTVDYLNYKVGGKYVIEFNWFYSLIVAFALLWMFISYCIQVGVRVIQLAYLQLISPIPILSYISDPDGAFKKWIKQCSTTFLDLFFRLAIIYFVMTIINDVINQFKTSGSLIMTSTGLSENDAALNVVKIFIILGLLIFAKRVPELLKDLFPNLGGGAASLGFGLKKTFSDLKDSPLTKFGWSVAKPVATLAKKGGGYVWKKTGGKGINAIKEKYNTHKEDKEAYKAGMKADKEATKTWDSYGNDFKNGNYKNAFRSDKDKSGAYAASYAALEMAKDRLKNYKGDTNSAEYRKYLADKEKAEKIHNANRETYKELARREDQLKRYQNGHPNQSNGSDSFGRSREEILNNINQLRQANGKEERTSFTDEERQAEAQRRESQRSSYNNVHESELASQSIFSDNDAMRQSDVEYNTGIGRSSASDNGAPTAENSIFNDDDAMRQSDEQYRQSQNNNDSNNND